MLECSVAVLKALKAQDYLFLSFAQVFSQWLYGYEIKEYETVLSGKLTCLLKLSFESCTYYILNFHLNQQKKQFFN